MDDLVALPEWTQVQQKGGLDPLGMSAATVRLYQKLLPGISNVTLHARYYGFYAWLSREYAIGIHQADPDLWKRMVRRAEALYALTAAKTETSDYQDGVAGIRWALRKLEDHGRSGMIDFSVHADPDGDGPPYLKQAWGAYGAAYESQLIETGVLGDTDTHGIRVPAPGLGDEMAEAFAHSAGDLGPKFLKIVTAGKVSLNALDDLAPLVPAAIHAQSRERALYERMLFAETASPTEQDVARRRSLILALRIVARLEEPASVEDVRWILYAGRDWNGKSFKLKEPELVEQRRQWWAYQAGDLGRMAYEGLFKWVLDVLETYPAGITLDRLVAAAIDALEVSNAGWPKTWRALVAALPRASNPLSEDDPTAERRLSKEVLEAGTDERKAPLRSAQAAIELLAVLSRECADDRKFLADQHGGEQPDANIRTLANELAFLDRHLDEPLADLLVRILRDRIVHRHIWVAMRKLQYQRDYTFLIEADDAGVRLRAKDGPVPTNPRLRPALTFLRDIHLVDDNGLTKRGQRLVDAS